MNIPKKEILKNCKYKQSIELLLNQAEIALSSWQPIWSKFLSAPLREEVLDKLKPLSFIECISFGGYANAERQRICFQRKPEPNSNQIQSAPIKGINIEGNFLFDRPNPNDFREAIKGLGIPLNEIGDIWLIRDRGAQLLCSPEVATYLSEKKSMIRDVEIKCEELEIDQLQFPIRRKAKLIKTVEASTRIDAIASAGFGLSRAKAVNQINAGKIRLNWQSIKQPNKQLQVGDKIHLEEKGSLEVLKLEKTKRERWRVELLRQ